MATVTERIKNLASANSSSWSTKEEEKAGRARMHENQKRRYTGGIFEQQHALAAVSKEVEDEDRAAAMRRKKEQDSEVNGFLEAQQSQGGPKAVAGLLVGKAQQRQEQQKSKGLPGFLAVKAAVKKKADECA
eukprot:CAMPEP_0204585746 /NCGR_PEP_ID=MMETSP0661-20131031/47098_1 /ASSEMBLY_ACC=CAM_ASM_000606 /TAXON_ID=109239 /ORGANISM="Alexandrium margalefi, Strain AMGDE01CS-322" /LENGTH=131 /DNA_ID=CAMNT_0051595325 /DNA_START=64 /DNA_END=456 /DNA_ORIENTATION=-